MEETSERHTDRAQPIAVTERFSGRVEAYERYRLRYPTEEVLHRLRTWCGLNPSWTVADIGAGTGMLSEVFLANGNRVFAVEPNAEMRHACERLKAQWPTLEIIDAAAETTGLPAATVDLVAAGRAFHWFDRTRALAEFRRILKPGGWVVLVALGRNHEQIATDPAGTAFEKLLHEFGNDYAYVREGYRVHENMDEILPRDLHQQRIDSEQQLDWDTLLGQTMSLSMAPRREDPGFPAFEHELRQWFEHWQQNGHVRQRIACWITAGRL